MTKYYSAFASIAIILFCGLTSYSQETEIRVVDEVVAQVNDSVITLSRINREKRFIIDAEVEKGRPRDEVVREVESKQGELIANMINEELIIQRAKELGLDAEIEANVNQRFLQIMQQYNLTTLEALYAQMRQTGVEPDEIRELWRKQATRELVIQREVQAKVYWGAKPAEVKDYFEKHKDKFTKPETVSISEIFLSYAGNTEDAVRAKADRLLAELKAGADFQKLVAENSDRPNAVETKGDMGSVAVPQLEERFPIIATAVKGVPAGGYSAPVALDETGLVILRVDTRTAGSNESQFDENAVRMAILNERAPEASRKFMASLREDSYIKINDTYRPEVSPLLFAEERKENTDN
jgi:peptidyl-prolyl cis-trans isomerase SurA